MKEDTQEIRAPQCLQDTHLLHSEVEIKNFKAEVDHVGIYDGDEDQLARLGKK